MQTIAKLDDSKSAVVDGVKFTYLGYQDIAKEIQELLETPEEFKILLFQKEDGYLISLGVRGESLEQVEKFKGLGPLINGFGDSESEALEDFISNAVLYILAKGFKRMVN